MMMMMMIIIIIIIIIIVQKMWKRIGDNLAHYCSV